MKSERQGSTVGRAVLWLMSVLFATVLVNLAVTAMRSPREIFVEQCERTYRVVDCWERWYRDHPMPDDYPRGEP